MGNSRDKFDQEEKTETKFKYNYYKKRSQVGVFELISQVQFRLSLYSIFNLTDDIEMDKLKTKKVRGQVRLLNRRSDLVQKEIRAYAQKQKEDAIIIEADEDEEW